MPRYWFDAHAARTYSDDTEESEDIRQLNMRIVADRKPYFMRYVYPALNKDYRDYIKNASAKCSRLFHMPLSVLLGKDAADITEEQAAFIEYYHRFMPVGMNNCVMNRICRRFEAAFDNHAGLVRPDGVDFDYSFMKYGVEYSQRKYSEEFKIYREHAQIMKDFAAISAQVRILDENAGCYEQTAVRRFVENSFAVCSDEKTLCDIVLDICYQKEGSKQFVWDICGETIIDNLLAQNGYEITYPAPDDEGDLMYKGERFAMRTININDIRSDSNERYSIEREDMGRGEAEDVRDGEVSE